jgi:hypothetical protein
MKVHKQVDEQFYLFEYVFYRGTEAVYRIPSEWLARIDKV